MPPRGRLDAPAVPRRGVDLRPERARPLALPRLRAGQRRVGAGASSAACGAALRPSTRSCSRATARAFACASSRRRTSPPSPTCWRASTSRTCRRTRSTAPRRRACCARPTACPSAIFDERGALARLPAAALLLPLAGDLGRLVLPRLRRARAHAGGPARHRGADAPGGARRLHHRAGRATTPRSARPPAPAGSVVRTNRRFHVLLNEHSLRRANARTNERAPPARRGGSRAAVARATREERVQRQAIQRRERQPAQVGQLAAQREQREPGARERVLRASPARSRGSAARCRTSRAAR